MLLGGCFGDPHNIKETHCFVFILIIIIFFNIFFDIICAISIVSICRVMLGVNCVVGDHGIWFCELGECND